MAFRELWRSLVPGLSIWNTNKRIATRNHAGCISILSCTARMAFIFRIRNCNNYYDWKEKIMRKFFGFFLTFLLALTVAIPVAALAVPDTAEAQLRESLPMNFTQNRLRARSLGNPNWSAWAWLGRSNDSNLRTFTFPRSWTRARINIVQGNRVSITTTSSNHIHETWRWSGGWKYTFR